MCACVCKCVCVCVCACACVCVCVCVCVYTHVANSRKPTPSAISAYIHAGAHVCIVCMYFGRRQRLLQVTTAGVWAHGRARGARPGSALHGTAWRVGLGVQRDVRHRHADDEAAVLLVDRCDVPPSAVLLSGLGLFVFGWVCLFSVWFVCFRVGFVCFRFSLFVFGLVCLFSGWFVCFRVGLFVFGLVCLFSAPRKQNRRDGRRLVLRRELPRQRRVAHAVQHARLPVALRLVTPQKPLRLLRATAYCDYRYRLLRLSVPLIAIIRTAYCDYPYRLCRLSVPIVSHPIRSYASARAPAPAASLRAFV
jgi:hypothetical protein